LSTEQSLYSKGHTVVTDDGYILNLWNVKSLDDGEKPPVLMVHALEVDMMEYVNNSPE